MHTPELSHKWSISTKFAPMAQDAPKESISGASVVVDCYDEAVLVARDVEHYPAALENARRRKLRLHSLRRSAKRPLRLEHARLR